MPNSVKVEQMDPSALASGASTVAHLALRADDAGLVIATAMTNGYTIRGRTLPIAQGTAVATMTLTIEGPPGACAIEFQFFTSTALRTVTIQ